MHARNRLAVVIALALAGVNASANAGPAGSGSTGNFPVITVPPPPMTSVANQPTAGADSTLWSNGVPGPQNSSITIPLPGGGGTTSGGGVTGGGGGPPPVTCTVQTLTQDITLACSQTGYVGQHVKQCQVAEMCPSGPYGSPSYGAPQNCVTIQQCTPPGGAGGTCTPGTTTIQSTASCPAGETVGGVSGGATTFTQTNVVTTTCPSGPSGPSTQTQSGWSPTVAAECATLHGGGGSSCTLAEVIAGSCTTCSMLCQQSRSGLSTCQAYGVNAVDCSYWGFTGSSCPAGATGGNWRAGLCP